MRTSTFVGEELNAASGLRIKRRDFGVEGSVYKQHLKNNNQTKVLQVEFLKENKFLSEKPNKTFENVFEYSQVEATSSDRLVNER